jgi:aminoglycoside phosphotransferase
MKTRKDKTAPSPGAQRQAAHKARREEQGFKRSTIWIRQADYDAGYLAAQLGSTNASECPADRDRLSWMLGYCAELDRVAKAKAEHQEQKAKAAKP